MSLKRESEIRKKDLSDELNELRAQAEQKQTPPKRFDPVQFLASSPDNVYRVVADCLRPLRAPGISKAELRLKPDLIELLAHKELIAIRSHSIVWPAASTEDCSFFLVLEPMYGYDPALRNSRTGWRLSPLHVSFCRETKPQRDIFCAWKGRWRYFGLYECVGNASLTTEDISALGPTGEQILEVVRRQLVGSPELVPPIVNNLIRDMYTEGIMKVQCFAFRRIGFKHHLYEGLQEPKTEGETVVVAHKRKNSDAHEKSAQDSHKLAKKKK
ncbi:hypothetical protein K474DRAFT_1647204 [Panus rudis PR-1116 ss-1]|nr:hypothetical protein K474DRAFT_1647204 [Panus rudis PR-1116 ss-1]